MSNTTRDQDPTAEAVYRANAVRMAGAVMDQAVLKAPWLVPDIQSLLQKGHGATCEVDCRSLFEALCALTDREPDLGVALERYLDGRG